MNAVSGYASIALWVAASQIAATENLQAVVQSIEVPAGERLVLKAEGRGVQIYRCQVSAWVFVAPEAKLFVKGVEVGSHGAGPVWHEKNGSSVWGEVIAKAPSPHAGAIPQLLLKAAKTDGAGVLASVNYIQRLETDGGNAPSGVCDGGAELNVPYTAQYLFYSPQI